MGVGKDIKIVMCGQKGCGKSSILELLVNGYLPSQDVAHSTVEDIYCAQIRVNGGYQDGLRIVDTCGLDERCTEIPRHLHSFADAYIIVYSVACKTSFKYMEMIKKDIDKHKEKKDAMVIILANKADVASKREVDVTESQVWAVSEKVMLWEVTTTDRSTLIEPFWYVASKMNPPQSKPGFANLKKTKTLSISQNRQ